MNEKHPKTIPSSQNILNQTTKQNSKRNLERRKSSLYKKSTLHSIKLSTSMSSYMINHVYSQNFIGHPKIILKKEVNINYSKKII